MEFVAQTFRVVYLTHFRCTQEEIDAEKKVFMKSLIIGTAKFQSLKSTKLYELVSLLAHERDVIFDVAPTYKSEEIVGFLQRLNLGVRANTKFSMQVQTAISREEVSLQLVKSEANLSSIDDFFLHSSDPRLVQSSAWDYLLGAKSEGRIKRIGFAGDGHQLDRARLETRFEVFQSTFSLIDQGNLATLQGIQSEGRSLQIKRVLGSGVLSRRRLAQIRRRISRPDEYSYQSRLRRIETKMKLAALFLLKILSNLHGRFSLKQT